MRQCLHWLPKLIIVTLSDVPVLQAQPHQQSHSHRKNARWPEPLTMEQAGPLQSQEARVIHQGTHNLCKPTRPGGNSSRHWESLATQKDNYHFQIQWLHPKSSLAHGRPMHALRPTLLSKHGGLRTPHASNPTDRSRPPTPRIGPGKGGARPSRTVANKPTSIIIRKIPQPTQHGRVRTHAAVSNWQCRSAAAHPAGKLYTLSPYGSYC